MSKFPLVSVVTITYNHEKYIEQTLESILSQETKFEIEVIVADDCSTDKTQSIIKKLSNKYSEKLIPILRDQNIGVQRNFKDALMKAKGEYIALCEGDDFWIDTKKLQTQVDYFRDHPGTSVCFHPVEVFYEGHKKEKEFYPPVSKRKNFDVNELLKWNFIQTNSVMYRAQEYDKLPIDILPVDLYLHLLHAQNGKIGFINRTMAVYRRHNEGIWWDNNGRDIDNLLKKHGISMAAMYAEVYNLFKGNREYEKSIFYRLNDLLGKLRAIDKRENTNLFSEALKIRPYLENDFHDYQFNELAEREKIILEQAELINTLTTTNSANSLQIKSLNQEMGSLKNSKVWKIHQAYSQMKISKPKERNDGK